MRKNEWTRTRLFESQATLPFSFVYAGQPSGKLPPPVSAMCAGLNRNESGEKGIIDLLDRNNAKPDYWWMDAGWYPGAPGPMGEWTQVGAWKPDAKRFPGGIKTVAEFAHAREMRLVL